MKTYQQWQSYKELELIYTPAPTPKARRSKVLDLLKQVWGKMEGMFAFGDEPIVYEKTDRAGNMIWKVYDPEQDTLLHFDSSQAVQSWLEERNYRTRSATF
jgi:hypothetical protein